MDGRDKRNVVFVYTIGGRGSVREGSGYIVKEGMEGERLYSE